MVRHYAVRCGAVQWGLGELRSRGGKVVDDRGGWTPIFVSYPRQQNNQTASAALFPFVDLFNFGSCPFGPCSFSALLLAPSFHFPSTFLPGTTVAPPTPLRKAHPTESSKRTAIPAALLFHAAAPSAYPRWYPQDHYGPNSGPRRRCTRRALRARLSRRCSSSPVLSPCRMGCRNAISANVSAEAELRTFRSRAARTTSTWRWRDDFTMATRHPRANSF